MAKWQAAIVVATSIAWRKKRQQRRRSENSRNNISGENNVKSETIVR